MENTSILRSRPALRWIAVLVLAIVMLSALVLGVMAATTETADLYASNLTLGEDIAITFWATIPEEDVSNTTAVFEYQGRTYPAISATDAETSGSYYLFRFDGITPQNMAEAVTCSLYTDGSLVDTISQSVADYCASVPSQDASLTNITAALLNYGAVAEWYVGKVTDAPTINGLPAKEHMSVVAEKSLDTADGTESATLKRAGLILTNVISTYFDFETSVANPSMAVTVDGAAREVELVNNGDGTYRAIVDLKATELFGKIKATVTDESGNEISRTATYSATAYLNKLADYAEDDGQLAMLVKAIYRYGYYAHDLDTHELMPIGIAEGKTVAYACRLCGEVYHYTLSDKAYIEDYVSGNGAVQPGGGSTLTNVDGALKVVIDDTATSNGDMSFSTASYVTESKSILVGFDIKSAANREADFGFLLKPNGGWDYQPKTWPVTVTAAGGLMVFGNEVATVSTDAFTSVLINLAVEQDTTDASDVAVFVIDAWIDGLYIGQFKSEAKAATGTTTIDMSASQIQLSTRRTEGKYNEIYLDNVILADGIDMPDKNVDEIATLAHGYELVEAESVAATCSAAGYSHYACTACGDARDVTASVLPHQNIELNVVNGQLVVTCPVCETNVDGGASWISEVLKIADGTTNNATNLPTASNGEYYYTDDGSTQWQPQFYAEKLADVATRRGVFSIKLKGNVTQAFGIQLYNRGDGWATDTTYSAGTAHGVQFLEIGTDGAIKTCSYNDHAGSSETIGSIDTETTDAVYTTITVVFEKDTVNDTFVLDYYVDGAYKTSKTLNNYLYNNTPHGIYISGKTTGMYVDDFILAWTDTERDAFLQHEHTLKVIDIDTDAKQLIYECTGCLEHYAMDIAYGNNMTETALGFSTGDIDTSRSVFADGVYTHSASQTASNANGYIAAYPAGKITSTSTMLLGFDIKNTENRAGYFQIQWRTPCTAGNWAFDGNETKLQIKPDGSIYFASVSTDTGLDISTTEFTSILMKATFTVDGSSTTLSIDLWVNGIYVATATKTASTTNATWQNTDGCGAQICVENSKGTNEVIMDNLFVADVPAGITAGENLDADTLAVVHNFGDAEVTEPTCLTTGSSTATCVSCGETVTATLEKLPHNLSYNYATADYSCADCGEIYAIESDFTVDFANGATVSVGNGSGENVDDALKLIAMPGSDATASNATIQYSANGHTSSTSSVIFGFDIKNTDKRAANFVLQWKTNTATSSVWDYSPSVKLTVDTGGNALMNGADTGCDVTTAGFTNVVILMTFTENGSSTTITQTLWLNGVYIGTYSESKAITGLTFQTDNTYAQFCMVNKSGENEILLDNIFFADVPDGASGTNLGDYMVAAHHFETVTVDPTCTEDGYTSRVCTDEGCDYSVSTPIPALGHNYADTWSYSNDAHYHACTRCDALTDAASHVWNGGEITAEPSCSTVGTMLYTCTVCNATKAEDIAKLNHTLEGSGTFSGTATTSSVYGYGTTTYYCSTCQQNVTFDTPIHNDFEGGIVGPCATSNYTFTSVTEDGNTYGRFVAVSDGVMDILTPNISNVNASYKDADGNFDSDRMIFSVRLKAADGYSLTAGEFFFRSGNGYYNVIKWDANGVLTLPANTQTASVMAAADMDDETATEGEDGVELPTIDLIPSEPTIYSDWTEITVITNLITGENDYYINGVYVGTSTGNQGTLPATRGVRMAIKFLNTTKANETAICIDDLTVSYAD